MIERFLLRMREFINVAADTCAVLAATIISVIAVVGFWYLFIWLCC